MGLDNARRLAESKVIREVNSILLSGFELEFQAVNGSDGEGEIDWDAVSEASTEAWCNLDLDEQKSYFSDEKYGDLYAALVQLGYREWDIGNRKLQSNLDSAVCEAEDAFREEWEENTDLSEFAEGSSAREAWGSPRGVNCSYDFHEDSSVKGGELVVSEPQRPTGFLRHAKHLLRVNDFTVDEGCSFHIHLSVDGVQHMYGERMQAEMLAYLLANTDRMPEGVQDRLRTHLHWYSCRITGDKYCAVHYHKRLGTWEFRLFGNIDNYFDARDCLILAYEAMRHAYRVKFDMAAPLVSSVAKFSRLLDSLPVEEVAKRAKEQRLDSEVA